jgi:nicotinamidase-related amidase
MGFTVPGNAAPVPRTALIVVDMLNAYEHADADRLTRSVERMLPQIEGLIHRAEDGDVLTIYVNDNFGSWNSNRDALLEQALAGPHGDLVKPIAPRDDTLFVVKARHSIFYQTPLEYLLGQEDVDRVVLTGQVTEQCILYSALDAYIRHFGVVVPRDAVASIHEDLADAALRMMELNMDAEITDAAGLRFTAAGGS